MNDYPNGFAVCLGLALVMLASWTSNLLYITGLGVSGSVVLFFSFREHRNIYRLRRMVRGLKGYFS